MIVGRALGDDLVPISRPARTLSLDSRMAIMASRAGVAIAPAPITQVTLTAVDTSKAAEPLVAVPVQEAIPLSDPRHPQHAEWLAQQQEEGSFLERHGLWVGLGAAALVVGGAVFYRMRGA